MTNYDGYLEDGLTSGYKSLCHSTTEKYFIQVTLGLKSPGPIHQTSYCSVLLIKSLIELALMIEGLVQVHPSLPLSSL